MDALAAMLYRMDPNEAPHRRLLRITAEHAAVIDSIIAQLARHPLPGDASAWLVAASRAELVQLRELAATDPSATSSSVAVMHLARLETLLIVAVEACAESASMIADFLARLEEFELGNPRSRFSSAEAAALSDRLAACGRAIADA